MVRYQKLTENELDTFIKMRIQQLREEGALAQELGVHRQDSLVLGRAVFDIGRADLIQDQLPDRIRSIR